MRVSFKSHGCFGLLAVVVSLCSFFAADVAPAQPLPGQLPFQRQVAQPPVAPRAPFQNTPEQEAYLDQVLAVYGQSTDLIKTFECTFIRWEYDQHDRVVGRSSGKLSHQSPDKGTYRVDKTEVPVPNQPDQFEDSKTEFREHWVTDGKVILEYDYLNKRVVERPIPPDRQGQAIQNSPIPFVFGAKPEGLRQRYWMRVITPPQFAQQEIWLEAWPRFQADASSYSRSIIRLNRTTFEPVALRLYLPTREYHSYKFENVSVNPLLPNWKALFSPTVPLGWKLVRQAPPVPAAATAQQVQQRR